jgi:hypothetical protein
VCPDWPWYSSFDATITWSGSVYVPYVTIADPVTVLYHPVNVSGTINVSDPGLTGEATGSLDIPGDDTDGGSLSVDCGLGCGEVTGPWSFDVFSVGGSAFFTDDTPQTWHVGFGAFDPDIELFTPVLPFPSEAIHTELTLARFRFNTGNDITPTPPADVDFPGRPTVSWSITVVAP